MTDPPDPAATPNPFESVGFTGSLDVTMPAGPSRFRSAAIQAR
jgi:hypothetical protein